MEKDIPIDIVTDRSAGCYEYSPLQQPQEIRYLLLHPGSGDDKIVCTLHHHVLQDEPQFNYEAISYAWGTMVKDHLILCNGRPLYITKNLEEYLRQTRLADQERTLWVDSICIDQDNDIEKGHQVRLMGRVYSSAQMVLITLGNDETRRKPAKEAASIISEVNQMVLRTLASPKCQDRDWDSFPFPPRNDPLLSDQRWESVAILVDQPWFNRGWVIQEAGLARDAKILWGSVEIPWIDLLRIYEWVYARAYIISSKFDVSIIYLHIDIYESRYIQEAKVFFSENSYYSFKTLHILNTSRGLDLTDPRDRIYAFLGLPGVTTDFKDIEINYKTDFLNVYHEFAISYITNTGDMNILENIQHTEATISTSFPSWVPQWQMRLCSIGISHIMDQPIVSSSHVASEGYSILDKDLLRVKALRIDRIKTTMTPFTVDTELQDIASIWKSITEQHDDLGYKSFSPLLAFQDTICMGQWEYAVDPSIYKGNKGAFMLHLTGDNALPDDPSLDLFEKERCKLDSDYEVVYDSVLTAVRSRRVVITDRGYLGLVPDIVREGDICCIIFGAKTPFILREAEDNSGHFKIIGPSYFTSTNSLQGSVIYPYTLGSGLGSNEDWLEWDLEEEDILLC